MSFSTGQQLMSTPTGVAGFSNPRQWQSKLPRGFRGGFQQQFTPEQMQLFSQLFGHVGPESYLSKLAGGDEGMFQDIEAPAWRNLQQAYGQLGSRYSSMGQGAQKSSGFRNENTALASNFAQDLASKRQMMQQGAIRDLLGLSQQLLGQRPYDQFVTQKAPSGLEKFLNIVSPTASSFAGGFGESFGRRMGNSFFGGQ